MHSFVPINSQSYKRLTSNSIQAIFRYGSQTLSQAGIDAPNACMLQLIHHVFDTDYAQLIAKDTIVSPSNLHRITSMIHALANHTPLSYVIGQASFLGRDYRVASGVLIPRPETEALVQHAITIIQWILTHQGLETIYECGIGSGIISIELSLQFPSIPIHAWDISKQAIAISNQNIQSHGASSITLHHANFFHIHPSIIHQFPPSILVSNPPYVSPSEYEHLDPHVKKEPVEALVANHEGLDIILKSIAFCRHHNCLYLAEIGHLHRDLLKNTIQSPHYFIQDMHGVHRFIFVLPKMGLLAPYKGLIDLLPIS